MTAWNHQAIHQCLPNRSGCNGQRNHARFGNKRQKANKRNSMQQRKDNRDMMTVILGQCDEATQAQVEADEEFADTLEEGRILDFIRILCGVCYDTSASGSLFQPIHLINKLKRLLQFDNQANNMYDFIDNRQELLCSQQNQLVGQVPYGNRIIDPSTQDQQPKRRKQSSTLGNLTLQWMQHRKLQLNCVPKIMTL